MQIVASQQQKNLCFKILKKSHPDLHSSILSEVKKGYSQQRPEKVAEIKQLFDNAGVNDRRLFIAVVIKFFHPALYENDNNEIPLSRGLNLQIAVALKIKPSNAVVFTKEARTWLKHDMYDLRKRTDEFYEQNLKQVNL